MREMPQVLPGPWFREAREAKDAFIRLAAHTWTMREDHPGLDTPLRPEPKPARAAH